MAYSGIRLKEIRKRNNISQEKIAEILNTNRVRISNIENGKMQMYFDEAGILCKYFNISADTFFEERNLSEDIFLMISRRFIKNPTIPFNNRRELIRKIHIELENEIFNIDSGVNVLNNDKILLFSDFSNKNDIENDVK